MKFKFLIIVLLKVCIGCTSQEMYHHFEGGIYGTTFSIIYASNENLDDSIRYEMEKINHSLSMFDKNSIISQVNRDESVIVDSLFVKVFNQSKVIYEETGGAFDISVAPLVNAWGFGYKKDSLPDKHQIDSLLKHVGLNKVHLQDGRIIKDVPGIELDASSIAKGLGVDQVVEYLDACGIRNYMVEIGGEVRVKGNSPKERPWRIGIDKPLSNLSQRELEFVVQMSTGALATSGNYRNFYIKDGKRYAHTINPLSGYPIETELLSVSVFANSCMIADAYATGFMVLGLDRAKQFIEQHEQLEACFIYMDNNELKSWMTEGFKKMIVK